MTLEQADRLQRIGTPILMLAAVLVASQCACFNSDGEHFEAAEQDPPKRNPNRHEWPDGESTGGEDEGLGSSSAGGQSGGEEEGSSSSPAPADDTGDVGSSSSGGETTGEPPEPVDDHCAGDCGDPVADHSLPACVCAPTCLDDDDCGPGTRCLMGEAEARCAIECDYQPGDCGEGMVCGAYFGDTQICMWDGEEP